MKEALEKLAALRSPVEYSLSKLVDEVVEMKVELMLYRLFAKNRPDERSEDERKVIEGMDTRLKDLYSELDKREAKYDPLKMIGFEST